MNATVALMLAIAAEVVATSSLKASEGFSRPIPSLMVVLGYASAFYLMSISLQRLPLALVYAVWSGVGLVGISLVGWLTYGERLNAGAFVGIGLIVAGVVILQLHGRSGH
ncbi:MAG: multidrug efflux SMR transporter [Cyanobacteria bacterium]|nr:multidrug efflux SMR transporter [Cyanobacteriota bacterium]